MSDKVVYWLSHRGNVYAFHTTPHRSTCYFTMQVGDDVFATLKEAQDEAKRRGLTPDSHNGPHDWDLSKKTAAQVAKGEV